MYLDKLEDLAGGHAGMWEETEYYWWAVDVAEDGTAYTYNLDHIGRLNKEELPDHG